ncbi:DNA polymerase III subunit alpha [Lactobacillus selangorensis]|uniref:DNA polymerase III subunit alpha n=1 Tax=Lactobacillus selangorensis TaxID=81857 RepID=UPI00070A4BD4|nr:DNA polymerase III subunit alpha [Lactobacillus selangorensis]
MPFTQLQVKSTYSLLKSTTTVNDLVTAAQERGYQAVALTDENVLYGVIDFYRAAHQAGLKPILGMTLILSGLLVTQTDFPLLLLAKNESGYRHLLKLSTLVETSATSVTFAQVQPLLGDLFVLTPGQGSELAALVDQESLPAAVQYLQQLQAAADADSLYLGISLQASAAEQAAIKAVHAESKVPLVALGDVRYLDPNDAFAVDVMGHIAAGDKMAAAELQVPQKEGPYALPTMTRSQADFVIAGLAEAAANTALIADQCAVTISFQAPQLPHFPTPDQESAVAYLNQLAQRGLQARFKGAIPDNYQQRLQYELGIINQMGFADYFLIVWDVVHHARSVGILIGPGRGSAAGSLVAYALAITEVDPIRYNLLFERFLNPNRQNMPDIDLDIPDDRREELLQYVHERYGSEHMAQIITFGTLAAKSSLRNVARVFGLSQFEASEWAQAIPNIFHVTLQEAYDKSQRLRNLVHDGPKNQLLYETACRLEGLPRNYSTHAAGIVLSAHALTDTVPLQKGSNGIDLVQFTKGNVEAVGLLKIDFLGLKNLTILTQIVDTIQKQMGQPFHLDQIPLDDEPTLKLFQRGETNGVFQFESDGIKRALQQIHPTQFEDVVATAALYRPGPVENIPTFAARKNGTEPVQYPDPSLKPILGPTYGVLVYQEQVMQVASTMGGLSLGEADLLRRAMSKKKKEVIDAERTKFIQGAQQKGYSEQTAVTTYDYIERFANYGFNRSHAVAYSLIAFWLAYLKVHYPGAFYTALLNSALGDRKKLKNYLLEMHQRGVKAHAPDVNRSGRYFEWFDQTVWFGLLCIKGLRRDFVDAILNERQDRPYQSLTDFLRRLDSKFLKADLIEPLIYSGAFDAVSPNRGQLLADLPKALESIQLFGDNMDLFAQLPMKKAEVPNLELTERLDKEEQYLGVYLSGHPVEPYAAIRLVMPLTAINELQPDTRANLLGYVRRIKVIRTKKGQQMAFVTVQDASAEISVTVFPNLFKQVGSRLKRGQVLVIFGKVELHPDLQIAADQIQLAANVMKRVPQQTLYLQTATPAQQQQLPPVLLNSQGQTPVVLHDQTTKKTVLLPKKYWVAPTQVLLDRLAEMLTSKNVVLKTNSEPSGKQ